MQQIHHRKANVVRFNVFYRPAAPANAPAYPLLPSLPISGHMFRDRVPQFADPAQVAAPALPHLGHSSAHDRSKFGQTFSKLAQEIGRFTVRGRFATAIRALVAGDISIGNKPALHGFTAFQASSSERLASQSAFFRGNTRRQNDLQECQLDILRRFDSKTIGIFTSDRDNRITGANQAFLRMSGHDRESLVSNGMSWTELTPLEWRHADEESLTDLKRIGIALPYKKEFFRKDGTRLPVLVTNTNLYRGSGQRLAFVVDLSDYKRAEEAARNSERRYQEAKLELERVNRVVITVRFDRP